MASVLRNLESLKFSCKVEDLEDLENFEFSTVVTGTNKDFLPKDKPYASREHREEARVKAAKVFEDKKYYVWCALVRCLDAKSVLFPRNQKVDVPAAWGTSCERFRSYERPRLEHLIGKLTSHRNESAETVLEYITRAKDLHYNLRQIGEAMSEQMIISILLKGLPKEYKTFITMAKFSKDRNDLEEIKRDLVNFEF